MDLTLHVENLRRELTTAAAAGGDDAVELADRLVGPLASSVRLTLLNALSMAADEITRELAPGSVEVRLRGLEPEFTVRSARADAPVAPVDATTAPPSPDAADGGTARINFRPPENLKTRIEEAAGREGVSVNAWLVRVASAALEPRRRGTSTGQSFTGWVR